MKIEHIGLWVADLEKMKHFYETFFNAQVGELYHNQTTGFRSYFLSFETGGRLEIMNREDITSPASEALGYAHLALEVGDQQAVDQKVQQLVAAGYSLLNGPRTTGDGYYEAVIADPENNLIEIMASY
ncbi:VOC family protein [Vagococcus zengguangii]|uniref:Glyoxalase n=1 Tax=Vagococcus zengguangii TaxID=2571750 RepID=A0A4D7CSX2_9ENTE|nr:VOC family protein [Vagococcus zengguangii]QCI85842.1 glyoxalase [Vagococcus zengguangii]